MTAKPIARFIVHASYAGDRTDHIQGWSTAKEAIKSAAFLYKSKIPLHVWVREHSFDAALMTKTIWRNDRRIKP